MGSGFQTFSKMVTDISNTLWPGPLKWALSSFSRLGPVFLSVPVMLTLCLYISDLNSDTVFPQYCKQHLGFLQVMQEITVEVLQLTASLLLFIHTLTLTFMASIWVLEPGVTLHNGAVTLGDDTGDGGGVR